MTADIEARHAKELQEVEQREAGGAAAVEEATAAVAQVAVSEDAADAKVRAACLPLLGSHPLRSGLRAGRPAAASCPGQE
jgi:hypothetical protein